jgi:two-component system sensor histidine kinase/response regulator
LEEILTINLTPRRSISRRRRLATMTQRSPFSVLVIDDNAQDRALAKVILETAGYTVRLSADGAEALESFAKIPPDLVLLDVMMPLMDGYEVCQRLRKLPGSSDVPIVFLTAMSELTAHQKALESGADDFLAKPLNRTELLIRVRSLLRIGALQRELRTNYDLIRSQRDALVRAERHKRELTDLIVHDLKNPVASILTNVEFALGLPGLPKEGWEALHDVVSGAQTMLRMLLNLLDVSRSEDGTLIPQLVDVELLALIEQVRSSVQRQADLQNRRLVVEAALSTVPARLDVELVRRIVENLVDNCLKYTPWTATVTVAVERSDTHVHIRVKDQGAGIPADQRSRVFEKYARIDEAATTGARSSQGLGLAFCKLATEAHGGRIWVEENVPQGAVFVIELPA